MCLEVNTLFGNPRDERFSFGACTPVSQHTQPVSRIVVVVQIAEKSSANLVCKRADPAWPSAPSAVADPTKPSRTSRSCSFSDRLTVLSVSFAERKGNRRQGQRRERSACTRSESSLRARDRLTRSKRTPHTDSTGGGHRRRSKQFSKTGLPSPTSRLPNRDEARAPIDAANDDEDLELGKDLPTRAHRTLR